MKKISIIYILVVAALQLSAATIRVNSTPGTDPDYTNIQAAIDAASSGDQIFVEGGAYEGFIVNKPLSIIGTAYANPYNTDIETPVKISQIVGDVIFTTGSSGSYMAGFNIYNGQKRLVIQEENLIINRCKIYHLVFETLASNATNIISNISMNNNIIYNVAYSLPYTSDIINVSSVNFSNTVFEYDLPLSNTSAQSFQGTFNQCIFKYYSVAVYNSSFINCIFSSTNATTAIYTSYNNSIAHCAIYVAYSASYTLGTNNVYDAINLFNTEAYYTLSDDSQAAAIGDSGQDAGLYAGSTPFVYGGYVPVPTITKMEMPSEVNGTLNLKIKATVIE